MVSFRIYGTVILSLMLCITFYRSSAQNTGTEFAVFLRDSVILSGQLHDADNESVEFKTIPEKSIFLWVTDKSCMPCYTKLEALFPKKYEGYTVNIIAVITGSPLEIRDKTASISSYYGKYDNLYFVHYDRSDKTYSKIERFAEMASPYFFVFKNNVPTAYYTPIATSKLIY